MALRLRTVPDRLCAIANLIVQRKVSVAPAAYARRFALVLAAFLASNAALSMPASLAQSKQAEEP
jgi:hypothetical protein